MKLNIRTWALVAVLVVAACGGREANPVSETRDIDASLSCDHLVAEKQVNDARVTDLLGEVDAKGERNFAMLLVLPLFLDLSDSEQQETRALEARNRHLSSEIKRRKCPIAK